MSLCGLHILERIHEMCILFCLMRLEKGESLPMYLLFVKKRKTLLLYMLALLCVFAWGTLLWEIPKDIYVTKDQELSLEESIPVDFKQEDVQAVFLDRWNNTYEVVCQFLGFIPVKTVTVHVVESQEVYPGGQTVGILLQTDGIFVVDTQKLESVSGEMTDPTEGLIKSGDYIVAVNGMDVTNKEELTESISNSKGDPIEMTLRRNGDIKTVNVTPIKTQDHSYKLGIWVKDDVAGVGTISFVDEEGNYGALGHGISSLDGKNLMELSKGSLYETEIAAINKGERGTPGSLVGILYFQKGSYLGTVSTNKQVGIFGDLKDTEKINLSLDSIPVGYKQEVKVGPATILCSADGEVKSYDINIEDISMNAVQINKSMLIRVTDEKLLGMTGGIIQGLSGSPIIQDGKLVGAVTHVLVNDPTRGYGIFIEEMLNQ